MKPDFFSYATKESSYSLSTLRHPQNDQKHENQAKSRKMSDLNCVK
jgi:hypothetical protein